MPEHNNGGYEALRFSDNREKPDPKKELRSWVLCIAIAVACALFLRLFVFEFVVVNGESMQSTLENGEVVFTEKITKLFKDYNYNEIVIVKYPNMEGAYVKRVIGLPGDTIAVSGGYLYRNGEKITESFTKDATMNDDFPETTVPQDCVFVMGDNRNNSMDSRDSRVGPIKKSEIIGHASCVLWPVGRIRGLNGYM